jgi:hypothetical protein
MSDVILLTATERDAVRGVSADTASAALEPVALTDGRYFLGVEVLADDAHAEHHELLGTLPTVPYEDIAYLLPEPEQLNRSKGRSRR